MRDRNEHLEWCKKRALECLDKNNALSAWMSMVSDLQKHEETKQHIAINLGLRLFTNGHLSTSQKMREFIEGFN